MGGVGWGGVLLRLLHRLSNRLLSRLFDRLSSGQCVAQFWGAIGVSDPVSLEGDVAQFQAPPEEADKALRGRPPGRRRVLWAGHVEPQWVVVRVVICQLQIWLTVHLVELDHPALRPIPDSLCEGLDVKAALDDAPWREPGGELVRVCSASPVVVRPGLESPEKGV